MKSLNTAMLALLQQVSETAIIPRFRNLESSEIADKGKNELVTIADKESEVMLAEGLEKLIPGLAIVGEEASEADPSILDGLSQQCWIIDPLDGTANFTEGKDPFGIIVALADAGNAVAGWLYDPKTDRLCHARAGEGAFVNGDRITSRTTGQNPPVAAISRLFLTEEQRAMVDAKLAPHYTLVDIPRCAAEQYPRLGLGVNDISSFKRTLAWDHAAGVLWLNEAGGKAARLDGSEYRVDEHGKPGLVGASNPAIWDEFVGRVLD